jgi:flavin reductase (DIM6/NTAB) family NADH-FMN oxidoreductase RutF
VAKIEIGPNDYAVEMLQALAHPGLLLVSLDKRNRPNAMTIGWGSVGIYWGEPIFIAPVRESRYTYRCLEHTRDFTVNVLPRKLAELGVFCGTVSGRDHDKFAEAGLTAVPGLRVKSPIIEECVLSYECEVVHSNDVVPKALAVNLKNRSYSKGDYHRLYFGRIVAVRAEENLRRRL